MSTFTFALILALYYEWRVGLVALTFVPLLSAILYKEGRMVSAESFGTAKTMEASSRVIILLSIIYFKILDIIPMQFSGDCCVKYKRVTIFSCVLKGDT